MMHINPHYCIKPECKCAGIITDATTKTLEPQSNKSYKRQLPNKTQADNIRVKKIHEPKAPRNWHQVKKLTSIWV